MTRIQAAALALFVLVGANGTALLSNGFRRQCLSNAAEKAVVHMQAFGPQFLGSDLARMNDCTRF